MKETKDSSQRLTKAEKSWILYDVANSAFIMIVTATIPIYFRSLAEGSGMSGTSATSLWGSASSISIMIHHTIVMTKEIRVAVTIGRPMVSQFKIRSSPATKGMQLPI